METQEFFKNWKSDSPIYENKKCKNCDNGCVGCDYFHKKIIPKIEKYKNKNSLKQGDL